MNRKLTKAQKKKARDLCRRRDGDRCNNPACGISGATYRRNIGRDLDLDHIDKNPKNNPTDGSNHQLLCHPCNCRKDPRGKRRNPKFNGIKKLEEYYLNKSRRGNFDGAKDLDRVYDGSIPPTMRKNLAAEPAFRRTVGEMIGKAGKMERSELLNAACEKAECHQSTGSNYLDKMCSLAGVYICELEGKDWYVRERLPEERYDDTKPTGGAK